MYPCPGIASSDADQELERVGGHGHAGRRDQGQQREEKGPRPVGVGPALRQAQRLQVVGEGDGDDGEVGGEGEDRKEGEEVVDAKFEP